jgi:uncharacterized RDD family membrane protein YckC
MMRSVTEDERWEPAVPLEPDYAGDTRVVGRRVAQFAVDVLLVQLASIAIAAFVALLARIVVGAHQLLILVSVFLLIWLWLSIFGWVLCTVLLPILYGGRTPAMRWFGLRVVTTAGETPRPAAHVIRCVATLVDGFAFGLIGLVVMANSSRQQRLGVVVAHTLVVRDRS